MRVCVCARVCFPCKKKRKKKNMQMCWCVFSLSAPLLKQRRITTFIPTIIFLSHTHGQSSVTHDVKRDVTAIQVLLPLQCRSCPVDPLCSLAEGRGAHLAGGGPLSTVPAALAPAKHFRLLLMAAKRASATSHLAGLWSSRRTGALWIKTDLPEV